MSGDEGGDLHRGLDEVGLRAAAELRRRNTTACMRAAWMRTLRLMLIVPLGFAAIGVFMQMLWPQTVQPSWGERFTDLAVWSFVLPLAMAFFQTMRSVDRSIDEYDGLARLDRELEAEGRLQAAYEFSAADERSPFMAAAVEDARSHLERARSHRIAADPTQPLPMRAWLAPVVSVALCALLAWLAPMFEKHAALDPTEAKLNVAMPNGAAAARKRDDTSSKEPTSAPKPPEIEPKTREEGAPANSQERVASREPERDPHESTGKTGEGASADATPTSATSDSRGFMSSQTQPSESGEQGKPSTKKPKPPKKEKEDRTPQKKLAASGATAGKGTGSGSSKNPGSTDWQSKDQVTSDEEQPLGEDAEVVDEDEESEARGGLQPSLRDRRPAVNRDLQIGFGNQQNPDANGRGGPSEQKKSRGVASLVLGVPLPDHVKGQPNPGRTKITQERVEPRSDTSDVIAASGRKPREQPIGTLARHELEPWMRELVRSFFLKVRTPSQ